MTLSARADRDRALVDDDRVAGERAADLLGGGEHVGEVGLARLARRRPDGDEHHLGAPDRVRAGGGEGEPALLHVAADELLEARLVDRDLARAERLDLPLVHVDAADLVPGLGEAGAGDEPDVTRADDRDLHGGAKLARGPHTENREPPQPRRPPEAPRLHDGAGGHGPCVTTGPP